MNSNISPETLWTLIVFGWIIALALASKNGRKR